MTVFNMKAVFLIIILLTGTVIGWTIKPDKVRKVEVIREKIIRVQPKIKIVRKIIEVPEWRSLFEARNVTVNAVVIKQVIITSNNAMEVVNKYQEDIGQFETRELKVRMKPWEITNGEVPKILKMKAELYYLKWNLEVKNDVTVIKDKKEIRYVDKPWTVGLGFCINRGSLDLQLNKEMAQIPIINLPFTLGFSYSLD